MLSKTKTPADKLWRSVLETTTSRPSRQRQCSRVCPIFIRHNPHLLERETTIRDLRLKSSQIRIISPPSPALAIVHYSIFLSRTLGVYVFVGSQSIHEVRPASYVACICAFTISGV